MIVKIPKWEEKVRARLEFHDREEKRKRKALKPAQDKVGFKVRKKNPEQ